jgi:hypothetical protein
MKVRWRGRAKGALDFDTRNGLDNYREPMQNAWAWLFVSGKDENG